MYSICTGVLFGAKLVTVLKVIDFQPSNHIHIVLLYLYKGKNEKKNHNQWKPVNIYIHIQKLQADLALSFVLSASPCAGEHWGPSFFVLFFSCNQNCNSILMS